VNTMTVRHKENYIIVIGFRPDSIVILKAHTQWRH